jgi:hypothetical protein
MRSVLLGAGFSKWAADLPVVNQLFDMEIDPHNARDDSRLASFAKYKEKWDKEYPGMHPEEFIRRTLNGSPLRKKQLIWYITRRLSDSFIARMLGGTQTLMIDDRRAQLHPGVMKAKAFVTPLVESGLAGIATCNYDLLAEYALGTSRFNYGIFGERLVGRGKNPWFPWQFPGAQLNGKLVLAKMHGSISWDPINRYTDGRCGVYGNSLIIPPEPEKRPPPALKDVWRLAGKILRQTTHLIVFGFAFNPYDVAVLNLLKKSGVGIQRISLIDLYSHADRAKAAWPSSQITWHPPPLFENGEIQPKFFEELLQP